MTKQIDDFIHPPRSSKSQRIQTMPSSSSMPTSNGSLYSSGNNEGNNSSNSNNTAGFDGESLAAALLIHQRKQPWMSESLLSAVPVTSSSPSNSTASVLQQLEILHEKQRQRRVQLLAKGTIGIPPLGSTSLLRSNSNGSHDLTVPKPAVQQPSVPSSLLTLANASGAELKNGAMLSSPLLQPKRNSDEKPSQSSKELIPNSYDCPSSSTAAAAVVANKNKALLPDVAAQLQQDAAKVSASLTSDCTMRLFPCRARGFSSSQKHNHNTAILKVRADAPHGAVLACSHPACASSGRRFRWCSVCQCPVAKRNFMKRHSHGIITSARYTMSDYMHDQEREKERHGNEGVRKRKRPQGCSGDHGDDDHGGDEFHHDQKEPPQYQGAHSVRYNYEEDEAPSLQAQV